VSDKTITVIVTVLLALGVGFYFFNMFYAAWRIFCETLMRKSKDHWARKLPADVEPMQAEMYRQGSLWQKEHKGFKQDVHIVNEGLNLYGEYYDMGFDRAVMVLSGRTESLIYGYYFAIPYARAGFNVLLVDPRGHGLSDGKYNTTGFDESRDALAWVRFLNAEHGVETVVFHGICIGAAAGMYALTSEECPDCVKGMVTEGMFATFAYSMKNHFIEKKRNFPTLLFFTDFWFKHYTTHSMKKGPIHCIDKLNVPLLMLQSKKDKYSTPDNAARLFEKCGSANKRIVYFDEGGHSMLRITDTERYDGAIKEFLNEYFGGSRDIQK